MYKRQDFLLDLARAAFRMTARYDAAIANYLAGQQSSLFPSFYAPFFEKARDLRYGENPFQQAAMYVERGGAGPSVATGELLWGKELSYNNLLDLDAERTIAGPPMSICSIVSSCDAPFATVCSKG